MMHRRYPKMKESTKEPHATGEWVVTEKVHGANFSVIAVADGQVAFASRSKVLDPGDNFFGVRSQRLDDALAERARTLLSGLRRSANPTTWSIQIYGELFGGGYPHPDVQPMPGAKPVQVGVWYAPELQFMAFDVLVIDEGDATSRFLDFDRARDEAMAAGFMFDNPLQRGTFETCLDFSVRFNTEVPSILGLPEVNGNAAEGVVIRPLVEPVIGRGEGTRERRMIKRKIPEFSEKQYRHVNWRDARAARVTQFVDEAESLLRFEMLASVTSQRLDNTVSKVGRLDPFDRKQCRILLVAFMGDVEETLLDDGLLQPTAESTMGAAESPPRAPSNGEGGQEGDSGSLLALRARSKSLAAELETECRKLVVALVRKMRDDSEIYDAD
jgi:Rnl2 family RNA ligase